MNIIFNIIGGIGKCIAATAVLKAIKKQYPNSTTIVFSQFSNIFRNNPNIDITHINEELGNATYNLYIKDKECKVFAVDPFFHNDFITEKAHLIKTWCKINDIKYNGEQPEIFLTDGEKEYYESAYNVDESYGVPKPIMAIHTNGGVNSPLIYPGYNWARDLPQDIIVKLIEEYREHYNIVHIKRPDQQAFSDTLECIDTPRGVAYMLLKSEKRIFIDSFAQHMAAALNLPSTVCWVTTNPTVFGYDLHDNVFANPHKKEFTTTSKTYSQYELNESIVDFPWGEDEEVFDINKIFKSINKI
tara:strand:+ start:1945 stop:2847 length:903 start_codon:yes stop_codon:yes gene_type:complete